MRFDSRGSSCEHLCDRRGGGQLERRVTFRQPTPVQPLAAGRGERAMSPAEALVRAATDARFGRRQPLLAVPPEFLDGCWRPRRQLVTDHGFERRHDPGGLWEEEQPEGPSRQRAEQIDIPLEEDSEVAVERRRDQVQKHHAAAGLDADRQAVRKHPDAA